MSVLTCISSSFHSVQMPFRNIWIDSTLSTLLDGWRWTAWGCYLKCCCHVLLVSRVVTVLLTLIGGPGFSSSRSVVPALLPPCSVLLRDTLRADCTGHGDLLLLAYFIENSHTAIQSTHVIQLWHNADADAWYKHYITATTYIWVMHDINITSLLQHTYEHCTTSPILLAGWSSDYFAYSMSVCCLFIRLHLSFAQ